jgi:hypothetical protein
VGAGGVGVLDVVLLVCVPGVAEVLRVMVDEGGAGAVVEVLVAVVLDEELVCGDVPVAVVDAEVDVEEELVAVELLLVELEVDEVPVAVPVGVPVLEELVDVDVPVDVDEEDVDVDVPVTVVDELEVVAVPPAVEVTVDPELVVVPGWFVGSTFVVHFVTFSNTSSPLSFFLGVRMISQVSVKRPALVSVVELVVTEVDPSGFVVWRADRGRALTWAERRRKKERKTKNEDWVGRSDCMVNMCRDT